MRHQSRGFFQVFFILGLLLGAFVCYRYAMIYFKSTEVENSVSAIILQNKSETDDQVFIDKILEKFANDSQIKFETDSILVFRNTLQDRVKVDYSFKAPVRLPSLLWGWDMDISGSVTEVVRPRSQNQ